MMCKIEPVYKVVKSRKMRSLTTRVDFIFGFCIKSWSRTHAISGIDHHWVMLSCYRDDSCRVGASFVRDRVSVFVARPAGRTFFRNGDTPIGDTIGIANTGIYVTVHTNHWNEPLVRTVGKIDERKRLDDVIIAENNRLD